MLFLIFFSGFQACAVETDGKKKFEASSLWGIRRGPNAPKAAGSQNPLEAESDEKVRTARQSYYEEQAKRAYLNSLSRSSASASSAGVSSSKQQECARKK